MLDTHGDLARFGPELSRVIADAGVVEVLARATEAQLSSQTLWFFAQHERILNPGYRPLPEDMLRLRVRTTGLSRSKVRPPRPPAASSQAFSLPRRVFVCKSNHFCDRKGPPCDPKRVPCLTPTRHPCLATLPSQIWKLDRPLQVLDVGGMRAERRKWPSLRRGVDCIFFVASLAEHAQLLAEDTSTNRMAESLVLFEATCQRLEEEGVPHCLFLTNEDELTRQLSADAPATLKSLGVALGEPVVGGEGGEGGAIADTSAHTTAELHQLCVRAVRRRFERVGRSAMTFVLNAVDSRVAHDSMDAALLFALMRFARTGQGRRLPSQVRTTVATDVEQVVTVLTPPGAPLKQRRVLFQGPA
jgi:hypothetical protein